MLLLNSKNVVFAFWYEALEELADRFYLLERELGENLDYQSVIYLEDLLKIMESNNYKTVYISSINVFDDLEEFFYFSEVVLGNGAHYYIDEEKISSKEMYSIGGILEKIAHCF